MNKLPGLVIDDKWILSKRGSKNLVDPLKPYAFLVEKERTASGKIEDIAVIFLTNPECPFHCLMCDLWKNTTDAPVPEGSIPAQIEYALERLPRVNHIKLYNSGSFFDTRAIPAQDIKRIASIISGFETVIVESHPSFIGESCIAFKKMLKGRLEVAIGLEIADQELLTSLNKKMSLQKFTGSVSFLRENDIASRAFVLLRPPFLTENEGVSMAEKTIDFAFDSGVECCTIIPVRAGNGAMEELMNFNQFTPPSIQSLEKVLEYGIRQNRGRVFADTWDLHLFSKCDNCLDSRISRITEMNLSQEIMPEINLQL